MQSIRFKTEGPILNDKILKIPDLRRKNLHLHLHLKYLISEEKIYIYCTNKTISSVAYLHIRGISDYRK
jgi:hypothetical protein